MKFMQVPTKNNNWFSQIYMKWPTESYRLLQYKIYTTPPIVVMVLKNGLDKNITVV